MSRNLRAVTPAVRVLATAENGTWEDIEQFFAQLPNDNNLWLYICVLVVALLLLVMGCTCIITCIRKRRRKVNVKNNTMRQSDPTTVSFRATAGKNRHREVEEVHNWLREGETSNNGSNGRPNRSSRRSKQGKRSSSERRQYTAAQSPHSSTRHSDNRNALIDGPVVIIDPVVYHMMSDAVREVEVERGTDVGKVSKTLSTFWGKVMREKVLMWQGSSTPYEDDEEGLSQQSSWLGHERSPLASASHFLNASSKLESHQPTSLSQSSQEGLHAGSSTTTTPIRSETTPSSSPSTQTSKSQPPSASHSSNASHEMSGNQSITQRNTVSSKHTQAISVLPKAKSRVLQSTQGSAEQETGTSGIDDRYGLFDFMAENGDAGVATVPSVGGASQPSTNSKEAQPRRLKVSFAEPEEEIPRKVTPVRVSSRKSNDRLGLARLSLGSGRSETRVSGKKLRDRRPTLERRSMAKAIEGIDGDQPQESSVPRHTKSASTYSDASSRVTSDGSSDESGYSSSSSSDGSYSGYSSLESIPLPPHVARAATRTKVGDVPDPARSIPEDTRERILSQRSVVSSLSSLSSQGSVRHYQDGDEAHVGGFAPEGSFIETEEEDDRMHRRSTLLTDENGTAILRVSHRGRIQSIPLTSSLLDLSSSSESEQSEVELDDGAPDLVSARQLSKAQAKKEKRAREKAKKKANAKAKKEEKHKKQHKEKKKKHRKKKSKKEKDVVVEKDKNRKSKPRNKNWPFKPPPPEPSSPDSPTQPPEFPSIPSLFELDLAEAAKRKGTGQGEVLPRISVSSSNERPLSVHRGVLPPGRSSRSPSGQRASVDVDSLDYYFRSSNEYRTRLSLSDAPPQGTRAGRSIGQRARQRAESAAEYIDEAMNRAALKDV